MGVIKFGSAERSIRSTPPGLSGGGDLASIPKPPEPNPADFTIQKLHQINGWTIALVQYPACTTYNGLKLMVFDVEPATIEGEKILDPHFLDDPTRLSPVARFEPTEQGLALAKILCSKAKR